MCQIKLLDFIPIDEDDSNVVYSECPSLCVFWEQLSTCLGLTASLIQCIKDENQRDSFKCWIASLQHWINQNYDTKKFALPSWRTLLRAVAKVDNRRFKQLVANHQLTHLGMRYTCNCYSIKHTICRDFHGT